MVAAMQFERDEDRDSVLASGNLWYSEVTSIKSRIKREKRMEEVAEYLAGIGVQRGVEDQFGPAHLLPGQTVPGGIEPQSHAIFSPAHRQGLSGTEQHCPQSRAIGGGDHLRRSGAVGEQAVQVLFHKAPQLAENS